MRAEHLFLADRNGDDQPDGEPEVILDGFDTDKVRHNIVNGLRWGPDGWLYSRRHPRPRLQGWSPRHARSQAHPHQCGIWRYHPTRKSFEVVCHGTTNPWGHDWDDTASSFSSTPSLATSGMPCPARAINACTAIISTSTFTVDPADADHYHLMSARKME